MYMLAAMCSCTNVNLNLYKYNISQTCQMGCKKKIRLKINIWYFHMNLNKTSYMLLNNIWKISDDQRGLILRDVINSYFYLSI